MTVLIFGEAAQGWPLASSSAREILIAIVGPLTNLVLAGLAYLIWNVQSNQSINLIALFLCGFNAWLFIINLIPAFPLDGGSIFRTIIRGLNLDPTNATRWGRFSGLIIAAGLTIWGIFLILQHSRFSWETGLITFLFVLIIFDGVRLRPALGTATVQPNPASKYRLVRILGAGLLCLAMRRSCIQPCVDQQWPGRTRSGTFRRADDKGTRPIPASHLRSIFPGDGRLPGAHHSRRMGAWEDRSGHADRPA